MNETHLPITDICLVAKPNNVPTGYHCIRKAYDDTNRDADLMADSLLERKDRFVCITRLWPFTNMRTFGEGRVLEDIKLINERETPPVNYTALTYTTDTREKGTTKRLICVKPVERQVGMKCICDIIFLYRTKRPPQSYTLIGEINGLLMCVKEGSVPIPNVLPSVSTDQQSKLYPNPVTGTINHITQQYRRPSMDYSNTNTLTKKADEKEILDGVPFEINSKYLNQMKNIPNGNGLVGLDSFRILSSYEIDQYFNYDFHIERATL